VDEHRKKQMGQKIMKLFSTFNISFPLGSISSTICVQAQKKIAKAVVYR